MANAPLRPKEKELYKYLSTYIEKHNYSPTYREIQTALSYDAIGSVQTLVKQLIEKEYLVNTGKWRGLALTKDSDSKSESVRIPLVGSVAAGAPIEAIETDDYVDIAKAMTKHGHSYFALKVKGDSMIEDMIADGDIVVVRKQKTANENEIVVALINNEATLKRFRKNKGVIELHPANKKYAPIRVTDDKDFEILGVLTGVVRNFN